MSKRFEKVYVVDTCVIVQNPKFIEEYDSCDIVLMSRREPLSIADSYSQITNYKLIFTKLDETTTLGNILNLKLHTGAELSYVTCGQNVPDDIADFSPQGTVKELLAGNR